jgi:hypothetical protein
MVYYVPSGFFLMQRASIQRIMSWKFSFISFVFLLLITGFFIFEIKNKANKEGIRCGRLLY